MSTERFQAFFITCPNASVAEALAERLVTERQAACVNVIRELTSFYLWEGKLHRDTEVLLMGKTTAGHQAGIEAALKALHPYQVPELIFVPIEAGLEPYLNFISAGTRP